MSLISPKQQRINTGLQKMRKDLPAKDKELYAGFDAAKKAITAILKAVDVEKIKITSPNDLYKTAVALSALIKCQVDYEQWNAERHGFLDVARKQLTEQVKNELARQPELREKLLDVIEHAKAKHEANQIEGETS